MKKCISFVAVLISLSCTGQDPYPFNGITDSPIAHYYRYLCDSNNNLTPQNAWAHFKEQKGIEWTKGSTFNVGIEPYIYWFIFPVKNVTDKYQAAVLRLSTSVTQFDFYQKDSLNNFVRIYEGNSFMPYNKRPFRHRDIAFPLKLNPNETLWYLISIDKRDRGLYLPLYLSSVEKTLRMEVQRHWVYGLYFGIFLFIIIFNIFLYFSLKDKIHLWYSAYIMTAILFMIQDEKFYVELFPDSWLRFCENAGSFPFSMLVFGCTFRVMQLFLNQEKTNSRFYFLATAQIYICFAVGFCILLLSFLNPSKVLTTITTLSRVVDVLFATGLILLLASSIEKIIQKQVLAVYYLTAITLPFIGSAIFYLNHLGITNFNPIQPNGLVVGLAAEIMILSFLLIVRYNNFKKEKERLLVVLKDHDQKVALRIVKTQEDERKRLAQDLHDDLGGTISILKLHISNKPQGKVSDISEKYYERAIMLVSKAADDLRSISHDLLPKDFSELGLFKIIENRIFELNQRGYIRFNFIKEGNQNSLNETTIISVYRILNEIINNIVKHSQASEATLQVLLIGNPIEIIAEDNGIGLEQSDNLKGIGLKNIASRVAFLKGNIHIDSSEKGTSLIISIPLNNQHINEE